MINCFLSYHLYSLSVNYKVLSGVDALRLFKMDFSLKDVFVKLQEEDVPFIGDLMNIEELENFEIEKKEIEVTSLSFEDNKFSAEVVLTADFSTAPDSFDHVIVGVRLLLQPDRIHVKEEISAVWTVAGFSKVREVPIEFDVTPAPSLLASYLLMTLKDFSAMQMLRSPFSVNCNFDALLAISKLEASALNIREQIGIMSSTDHKAFDEFFLFVSKLHEDFTSHVEASVSKLGPDNWIFTTHYIVRKSLWVEERISVSGKFLQDLFLKYTQQNKMRQFAAQFQLDYINDEIQLQQYIRTCPEVYIIYVNSKDCHSNESVVDHFLRLKYELDKGLKFCVVNLELALVRNIKPFIIQQFKNGSCVVPNLMIDVKRRRQNMVKCNGQKQKITPKRRTVLEMSCPGFYSGNCPEIRRIWQCSDCQGKLHFGFDENLYCLCGGAETVQFSFRCEDESHRNDFIPMTHGSELELNSLKPMETTNILVLGQTGVGKSTWINAFVNYMAFDSLDEARQAEFLVPIPVRFTYTQRGSSDEIVVECGSRDENEHMNVGESATQNCRDYNIVFENKVYNIIDTPGLGDARGMEEDQKNVQKILDHLRQIDVIHGICLVLKPNESRITVLLKYCVNEILKNLHKSCSNNLLLCFTHARSTFYRPGDSLPLLQKLLKEIDIDVSCLDRAFHMDNEAFRFLCCLTAGIEFSNDEEAEFCKSWNRSVAETKKLLGVVSLLPPHRTADTVSMNSTRNRILLLMPFLVEISENIERNLQLLEYQLIRTLRSTYSKQDMKEGLKDTVYIKLEWAISRHPKTVCADGNCVQYNFLRVSNQRTSEFVTSCHEPCHDNVGLQNCVVRSGSKCQKCFCDWDRHLHILYESIINEQPLIDLEIDRIICDSGKKSYFAVKDAVIRFYKKQISFFEEEKRAVILNCVKFAYFLEGSAVTTYNDSFPSLIGNALRQKNLIANKTKVDVGLIVRLENLKRQYREELEKKRSAHVLTVENFESCENELYALPIHGKQLNIIMNGALKKQMNGPRDILQSISIIPERPKREKNTLVDILRQSVGNFFNPLLNALGGEGGNGRGRGTRIV